MAFQNDRDENMPAARKGSTPDDGGLGALNPTGDQWSAPLHPDHIADWPTGSSVPAVGGGMPPSTPYTAGPLPAFAPPPPVGPRLSQTSPQGRRRRGVAILLAFIAVLLAGTISALLFLRTDNGSTTDNQSTSPALAVATDTPIPTATLKPGQTPLPTRVPTQPPAPVPTQPSAPGAPPLPPPPTATPIPYASSATASFTAASRGISSPRPTLTAATSGGDISATVITANVNAGDTQSSGISADETAYGSQDSFDITVINNTGFAQNVPTVITVGSQSQDGSGNTINCVTSDDGSTVNPVQNGGKTYQLCTVTAPARAVPSSTYNNTINGWTYTGTMPGGGSPPVFTVPGSCASSHLDVAHAAAQAALAGKLGAPGGTTVFSGPSYSFNDGSATCTPAAGTTKNTPFNFTVSVAGAGSESYYNNGDVQAFEAGQLQNAAVAVMPAGNYQLLPGHNQICGGGGSDSNASATSVTISCPASGLAGWIWSNSSVHSVLDPLITGQPKGVAISTINSVQGVAPGSASVSLSGGSYVPQNGSAIIYTIQTP